MILPCSDLLTDVEQESWRGFTCVLKPNLTGSFPHIHPAVGLEGRSNRVTPRSRDRGFRKAERHRCGRQISLHYEKPYHCRNRSGSGDRLSLGLKCVTSSP